MEEKFIFKTTDFNDLDLKQEIHEFSSFKEMQIFKCQRLEDIFNKCRIDNKESQVEVCYNLYYSLKHCKKLIK